MLSVNGGPNPRTVAVLKARDRSSDELVARLWEFGIKTDSSTLEDYFNRSVSILEV